MRQRMLDDVEVSEDVCPKSPFELRLGYIHNRLLRVLFGCVVHYDIESAKSLSSCIYRFTTECLSAHVASEEQAFASHLVNHASGFLSINMLIEVDDRYIRPLLGEGNRDCTADTAVATGNDCHLFSELVRRVILALYWLWQRAHFRLNPRLPSLRLGWTLR